MVRIMERTRIDTRLIKSIGYDREKKIMTIEFTSDMIYQYNNFPEDLYDEIVSNKSIDKFFKINVVNKYHYNRLK
jgi:metal-dependent HD superfamily phosphatase/phosphodiesterase